MSKNFYLGIQVKLFKKQFEYTFGDSKTYPNRGKKLVI